MEQRIIDLHCDTVQKCYVKNKSLSDYDGHINIEKLREGGALAQCFALWMWGPNENEKYIRQGLHPDFRRDPYELYHELLHFYKKCLIENADSLSPAISADDIRKNATLGRISAILTTEDATFLDGKPERIYEAYSDGVRMMTITWNYENSLGHPNSSDIEEHKKGLKKFGFEAVEIMNELGIIIDVSHLSEGGFWDVCRHSKKPIAASHSCSKALADHARNLTDEQLKAVADKGGIVGVNFYHNFLSERNDSKSTIDDVIRHLRYMKNLCGIETLAWGSDFDGIDSNLEFRDYSGYPLLLRAAELVFTPAEMDKLNRENFLRIFEEQETKSICGNCDFEWSAIHLGAGLMDEYKRKG